MNPSILIKHNIGNTLTIQNILDIRATTYTTNVYQSGVTSIGADNPNDFTSGSTILLLLGGLGNENAEIVTSTTHSGTTFTVSTTTQNHARGEVIQQIKWDKLQIFKSSTIDGSYTQVGSDILLNVTNVNTVIYDTAGLTTDYYKLRWKNSVDSTTSDLS